MENCDKGRIVAQFPSPELQHVTEAQYKLKETGYDKLTASEGWR